MTYFNPLVGPVAQSAQAQKVAASDKERQVARAQALARDSAAEGDRFEHAVESADALSPVGDDATGGGGRQGEPAPDKRKKSDAGGGAEPHLDVKG
jgi:hypothetical protein